MSGGECVVQFLQKGECMAMEGVCSNGRVSQNKEEDTNLITMDGTRNLTIIHEHNYSTFKYEKYILAFFMLFININFFQNLALLIANCQEQEVIEENYYYAFHSLDFYGAFLFALIEGCVLILTRMVTLDNVSKLILISINIGGTLVALILNQFNAHFFEETSHWIEYSVQLFLTLTDFLFIFGQQDPNNILYRYRYQECLLILISLCLNFFKLLVFGDVIHYDMGPERAAHFFEYSGEMFNDAFAFTFTYIRFKNVNHQLYQVLLAPKEKMIELVNKEIESQ